MDFLDNPLVRALLIGTAFGTLVSWLFGRYLPIFNTRSDNAVSLDMEDMIQQLTEGKRSDIRKALDGHRKIEAIKHFRAATNAGLLDAKNAVEHLTKQSENTP